jgi:hypothetical protein
MEDNKLKNMYLFRKVDGKVYPIAEVTADKDFFEFPWRPEDRPKSKDDLLNRKRIFQKRHLRFRRHQKVKNLGQ